MEQKPSQALRFDWLKTGIGLVLLIGAVLRVWGVHTPDFIFYDEGLYCNTGRSLLEYAFEHPPQSWEEWRAFWVLFIKTCLASGKPLWIFLINLRLLFGGLDWWAWPRVLSALFSIATLFLLWCFVRRWRPQQTALAFCAFMGLALWPSHIFYARTALQESLAAFLFLWSVHVYWKQGFRFTRIFLSGLLGACVYFSNYRLILLPCLMALVEGARAYETGERFGIRRWVWWTVVFASVIGLIGGLWNGLHLDFILRWMLYQWNLAEGHRQWLDFVSYPYYLWRLDHPVLWILFMIGTVIAMRKARGCALPYLLVWAAMFFFSFAKEQAARYTAFLLPFYALGCAVSLERIALLGMAYVKKGRVKMIMMGIGGLVFLSLMSKDIATARIASDYRKAAYWCLQHGSPQAGWAVAQEPVMNLYHDPQKVIVPANNIVMMARLVYEGRIRFLILEPQVYVSYTHSLQAFDPPLISYLQAVLDQANPTAQWPHLSPLGMERFVFEHNQDLRRSIRFLEQSRVKGYHKIYVYDLKSLGWDRMWRWILKQQHGE